MIRYKILRIKSTIRYAVYGFVLLFGFTCMFGQKNLPLLDMNKTRFDFGVTKFMERKSDRIVLRNIGDTVLTIYHVDSILKPFKGKIAYPDTLNKNDSVVYVLSYAPTKAAKDSQRVFLRADTRLSNSIGLLLDASLSMNRDMNDNVEKLTAANNAVTFFINSMLATPKVWDEAAIFSFARNFYVNCDFTTNKTSLKNSLSKSTYSYTAFYDACIEAINRLKLRKYVRVLVALTDGEDNSSRSNYIAVINAAKAANVKVYTIGISSSTQDAVLTNIATQTGGQFFKARTSKELQDIYFKIFSMLSKNIELWFDLLGSCSSPALAMSCSGNKELSPGDTVNYPVYLTDVSSSSSQNHDFTLYLSFNPTMLLPLNSNSVMRKYGKFEIRGTNTSKYDTVPLIELNFLTLLGNEECTNLKIDSLRWDDTYYPSFRSGDSCYVCISACVRNLRQIEGQSHFSITQFSPNPASAECETDFVISEDDSYQMLMYDVNGSSTELMRGYFRKGKYKFNFDLRDYPSGIYSIILRSSERSCTKQLMILK